MSNDYGFENPVSDHILSLAHLFYRLGLHDRPSADMAQGIVLGLLGGWLFWQMRGPSKMSQPAACSLIACYSTLFLYHRHYDLAILVLPLVYSAGRSLSEKGWSAKLFLVSSLAVLTALYLRRDVLEYWSHVAAGGGIAGWLIERLVLPLGDVVILVALFALAWAERFRIRAAVNVQTWHAPDQAVRLSTNGKVSPPQVPTRA